MSKFGTGTLKSRQLLQEVPMTPDTMLVIARQREEELREAFERPSLWSRLRQLLDR